MKTMPKRLSGKLNILACAIISLMFSTSLFAEFLSIPLPALNAKKLAIIVNDADPISIKIAAYYQQQRKIPDQNIIHVSFKNLNNILSVEQFKKIKQKVDAQSGSHIQAYALTWMKPYRVGCMSITTAFAAGYDESFCAIGCKKTQQSPYYNSLSSHPFTKFKWRPTMMLAGENFEQVKKLIDRGIASDFSQPLGAAYLLETSDKSRSVRSVFFPAIKSEFDETFNIHSLQRDYIENKKDVMFYFTGKTHIKKIDTNTFLPGAVADHLTSTGGVLFGGSQMKITEWLKAGATGSYGTVVEPCNFVEKFPNPKVMMYYYIRGNSLIEAYWKSVAWPGQGIFIGEPLSKPFAYQHNYR